MKIRKEADFISCFDEKTGRYFRTGILVNGKESGKDPFMASFPELLDVGIMGHCIHGKTGLCLKAGVECYQDGLHASHANMSVEDFKSILEQCRGNTFQIALGGCGDPDQHENFEKILKLCRDFQIVVNFTTSGFGMTPELADLCKHYCGAVAVSWYRSKYTMRALEMLLDAGVKTNIHYVLSRDTVAEAVERLKLKKFQEGINAVVFLLHKPVGLGTREKIVSIADSTMKELLSYVNSDEMTYKIGFDSCTVPALLNYSEGINIDSLDTCEGGRWSAYITSDMKMLPCSFDNQEQRWAVDLRKHSIKEAWESKAFDEFRTYFKNACPSCKNQYLCKGGCPICPEIVLCTSKDRSLI